MKFLTDLEIQKSPIQFKVDHTKTDYKYFKIVEYLGWVKKSNKKYPVYKAICKNCNKIVAIPSCYFTDNKTIKSCGCSRKLDLTKVKQNTEHPAFKRLYLKYKSRDKYFDLTTTQFFELVTSNCYYCGNAPNNKVKSKTNLEFEYNGLDRVDPKKSYTFDNVVTCCKTCNFMKGALSQKTFFTKIGQIYNFAPGLNKFDKFGENPINRAIPSQANL